MVNQAMENAEVICKTDAEILLKFEPLKDSGFAFEYIKKEDGGFQYYVNCNGKVFGPFDDVFLYCTSDGIAEWSSRKGDIEFKYENNGKDCKTEKLKGKKEKDDVLEQIVKAFEKYEAGRPDEEYDEKDHVLKLNRKHLKFFVTDNKKYGPYYSITSPIYQNENCFQFVYRKSQKSKNWYYNHNGKEIGPFQGKQAKIYYDEQNRAIVESLSNYNFILVDGKKEKCFREKYTYCNVYEKNNHKIIVGLDHNNQYHFKRDGIMLDFSVRDILIWDNGDVAYSKIQDDKEAWFYNDKQISLPVKGYGSAIYDSIITYKRSVSKNIHNTPYFMKEETEYNGMPVKDYDEGFVYLDEGTIQFFSWCVPKLWDIESPDYFEKYARYRNGMFLRLFNTNKLAGRD